jgi:hypothetical protein
LLSTGVFSSRTPILAVNAAFRAVFAAKLLEECVVAKPGDNSPIRFSKSCQIASNGKDQKKGAEVRRRGVKFSTSARGFV